MISSLSFFPGSAPDETLYSSCARYHSRSGNRHSDATGLQLFGFANASRYRQIPMGLAHFQKVLQLDDRSLQHFLSENTICSLYTAFLRAQQFFDFLDVRSQPPSHNLSQKLGLTGGYPYVSHPLKYCSECCKEDQEKLGFTYWHRKHQYPGVWICHLHFSALTNHVSSSQAKDDWRRCPSPESPEFQVSVPISNPLQTFLYKLLLTTDWLSQQANLTESFLRSIVRSTLSHKLGTSNERSHIGYLTDFVRSSLEDLSGVAAPEISDAKHGRWISALIHGATVCHPVHWAIALSSLPQVRDPIESEHSGRASLSFCPIPDLFPVAQSPLIVQQVDITATLLNGSNIKTTARNQRVPKAHLEEVIKHAQPLSDIWNAAKRERKRAEYRQEVFSLLLNEECASLLELFQRAPIKIRWLCRYDRNWVDRMLRNPPTHHQMDLF